MVGQKIKPVVVSRPRHSLQHKALAEQAAGKISIFTHVNIRPVLSFLRNFLHFDTVACFKTGLSPEFDPEFQWISYVRACSADHPDVDFCEYLMKYTVKYALSEFVGGDIH